MNSAFKIIDSKLMDQKQPLVRETESVDIEISGKQNKVPHLKDCKLLIAEDDCFSYEIMKHQLSETKASLIHANTGTEAIEIIETEKFDLLILDLHLPDMNGFEVFEQIRQNNKDLPVIAQTAFVLKKEVQKIINCGFSDLIIKPYSKEALYNLLNKHLNHLCLSCL